MTSDNDIAIIFLNESVSLNENIKTACLPFASTTYPRPNQDAWAIGWVLS